MTSKKRKRRLGHITDDEKRKVRLSIAHSISDCRRRLRGRGVADCIEGVETVEFYLKGEGF